MKLNWVKIHKDVQKLQNRIAKAVLEGKYNTARKLAWLLVNSFYAKIIAVFRVINNKGAKTAGVDGVVWDKKTDIVQTAKTLRRRGYKPLPLKRIYIRKRSGKLRPLGIPTMYDRAMQALYLLALQPFAETTADLNSYGFRQFRSCRDANRQVYSALYHKNAATWVLEADIKGCFDNISHAWLLAHIPMDKQILRKWLTCGYIENHKQFPTVAGTPQGGIISPTLMNMTLDGLERLIRKHFPKGNKNKVNFIRYADDFMITATSKEVLVNIVLPLVKKFLAERGLSLSDEKTKITNIKDGFNFLSQNSRKYKNGKLMQKPSDDAIRELKYKLRQTVFKNLGAAAHTLINAINSILRGWTNYHRHIVSKEIFKEIDFYLWQLLGKWCKRRHPNKAWKWIRAKYFSAAQELCSFASVRACKKTNRVRINKIFRAGKVPIIRYSKVKSAENPYTKQGEKYFEERRKELWKKSQRVKKKCVILQEFSKTDKKLLHLWKVQPEKSKKATLRNARAV